MTDDPGDRDDIGRRLKAIGLPEDTPLDEWTEERFGHLTLEQVEALSEPDNGILNKSQQASFDAAKKAWAEEVGRTIRASMANVVKMPDMSGLVTPGLREAIAGVQRNLTSQLDVSKQLGVRVTKPDWGYVPVLPERISRVEIPTDTSADELAEQTSTSIAQLAVLESIVKIMQDQADTTARAAVFYVVVGLATMLGGVAALLALDDWGKRGVACAVTLVFASIAWLSYVLIGRRGRKQAMSTDGQASTPTQQ